jgi:alpha-maltose-1-phosphate synthase
MTPLRSPQIVCVAPGSPFDSGTWSGISLRLLTELDRSGALLMAVDGRPGALDLLEKVASFDVSRDRWRQRYNSGTSPLSPLLRQLMSTLAERRALGRAAHSDAVLRLTGWYAPRRANAGARPLQCAYHDGSLVTYLRRPDLALDRRSRAVRRALDYECRLHDRTDLIFAMSEWLARAFVDEYGQAPEKVVTVGAGPGLDEVPHEVDRDYSRPRYLFVGKEFVRKGGPQLLQAFAEVREWRPDAELAIVGPDHPPSDQAGVRFFGRLSRVVPAGAEALDRAFREATVFVMPSVYEPFGIAFLEAMAFGLPCVGSATCAMPEIIEDEVTGYVVPPGDVQSLAARMLDLADRERARRMGGAGRRRMLERYTWAGVSSRILAEVQKRLAVS